MGVMGITPGEFTKAAMIADKWVNDTKRHPNSEKVLLARAFLAMAEKFVKLVADAEKT